jgi:Radical SAM superfamily
MLNSLTPPLVAIDLDSRGISLLEIHWILTRRCQYSCWYCPPHRHDPKAQHADERTLLAGLARIGDYVSATPARINLTGGEPTIHPAILSFVRAALAAKPIRAVRIVTNLAGPLSLFSALASINRQSSGVQIVASFHPDRAQVRPFMDRVEALTSGDVPVLIKVLGRGDGTEESATILAEIQSVGVPRGVEIMVQRIRQSSSGNNSRADLKDDLLCKWSDLRIVRRASGESDPLDAEDLIARGANRFQGWKCDAGRHSLFIDSDGSFHAALCRPHGQPLANLFDPADELPIFQSVHCPHAVCGCASTIRIPKRAVAETYAPTFEIQREQ